MHLTKLCLGAFVLAAVTIGDLTTGTPTSSASNIFKYFSRRIARSVKDAYVKDEQWPSQILPKLKHKINSLEKAVTGVNIDVQKMADDNMKLETAVAEGQEMYEQLNLRVSSLQEAVFNHSTILGNLDGIANSDNLYVVSNYTCGGALVGKSGTIVFSSATSMINYMSPSAGCIWAVRANNHAVIKLSTQISYRSSYAYSVSLPITYVLDFPNKESNNSSSNDPIQPRITRLDKNMHYSFVGPTIYVVYSRVDINPYTGKVVVRDEDSVSINFHLHFEGIGGLIKQNTLFAQKTIMSNTTFGTFSDTELESWSRTDSAQRSRTTANYSMDYAQIIFANISGPTHLHVNIDKGDCKDSESFVVITDLFENVTSSTDCCKTECNSGKTFVSYGSPFIFQISKKFQHPLKFNLSWAGEKYFVPSLYTSQYYQTDSDPQKCRRVLGGLGGTLSITVNDKWQRCVWVIAPQTKPPYTMKIHISASSIKQSHSTHLYMMQLHKNTENGTSTTRPTITRLSPYGTYTVQSTEVYIVYYADILPSTVASSPSLYSSSLYASQLTSSSTRTSLAFNLRWEVYKHTNSNIQNQPVVDVIRQFTFFTGAQGTFTRGLPLNNFNFYRVLLLTPSSLPLAFKAYEGSDMQLRINQTNSAGGGSGTCIDSTQLSVYTAVYGELSQSPLPCNNSGSVLLEHTNGMAAIVLEPKFNASETTVVDFSWTLLQNATANDVIVSGNRCGGVIQGNNGILAYKTPAASNQFERCIWILHCPNRTSITLEFLKGHIANQSQTLRISTVELSNGTLRSNYDILRPGVKVSFNESLVVITLSTAGSTYSPGFKLRFTSSGQVGSSDYTTVKLAHRTDLSGNIEFSDSDWNNEQLGSSSRRLFVIASSHHISNVSVSTSMYGYGYSSYSRPRATTPTTVVTATDITLNSVFVKKDNDSCDYDSITFYTTAPYRETTSSDGGWLETRIPSDTDIQMCPQNLQVPTLGKEITSYRSSFIAIYKPISSIQANDDGERGFSFNFAQQLTSTSTRTTTTSTTTKSPYGYDYY